MRAGLGRQRVNHVCQTKMDFISQLRLLLNWIDLRISMKRKCQGCYGALVKRDLQMRKSVRNQEDHVSKAVSSATMGAQSLDSDLL